MERLTEKIKFAIATGLALGGLGQQVFAAGETETYTVKPDDTLSKIAKIYPGVTWQEICDANGLPNCNLIHPGQRLAIPTASKPSAAQPEAPVLFDADSCPPEENPNGCSLDVGVNDGQIGVAFGWHVRWPHGGLDVGGGGCDLVVLRPGWYENLQLLDGRYEVYNLPATDYEGWVRVLATQRANEQAAHYGCPTKRFENIPQWDSSYPSPARR